MRWMTAKGEINSSSMPPDLPPLENAPKSNPSTIAASFAGHNTQWVNDETKCLTILNVHMHLYAQLMILAVDIH